MVAALGISAIASPAALAASPCRVVLSGAPHPAYATLAQAVSAASPKETLTVSGICEGDTTITKTPLTIQGTPGATLNGEHQKGSVLTIEQGVTVVASGLTITGGTGTKFAGPPEETDGGGVFNLGTLTLSNSYVTRNEITEEYGYGGGIENFAGTLTLNNSIVSHNSATGAGGGMFDFRKTGVVTLNNSTVTLNTSGDEGGGIFDQEAALTLNNSSVISNTAKAADGGIAVMKEATALLNSSAVIGNKAEKGGGIGIGGPVEHEGFPAGATVSLKGLSTVLANTASAKEHGGGIYVEKGGKLNVGVAIVALNTPENIFREP